MFLIASTRTRLVSPLPFVSVIAKVLVESLGHVSSEMFAMSPRFNINSLGV